MIRKIIVLLGKPGSGKGVFSKFIISNDQSFIDLGTGNLARTESKKNTKIGREIKEVITNGKLLSDHLISQLLFQEILNNNHNIVCDGYPRTMKQFQIWEQFLNDHKQFQVCYWILNCHDDLVLQRISGRLICSNCNLIYHSIFKKPLQDQICDHCQHKLTKRADDLFQARKRLQIFNQKTKPLIIFLQKQKNITSFCFDGSQKIDKIEKQIIQYFVERKK